MKKKKIENIISFILVGMLCTGMFGIFSQLSNSFSDDFIEDTIVGSSGEYTSFYLTHEKKNIYRDTNMTFTANKDYRFDVKYTFDFLYSEKPTYNVKIISNAKNNAFQFTVNGESQFYLDGIDFSQAFSLQKYDSFFVFEVSKDLTLEAVLSTVYGGKTVEAPLLSVFENPYLFTLVVSSYDEKVVYNIDFTFVPIEGFLLNYNKVVL